MEIPMEIIKLIIFILILFIGVSCCFLFFAAVERLVHKFLHQFSMMVFWPFCLFCGKSKGKINYICQPGYSNSHHYYYHKKCVQSILEDPDSFTYYIDIAMTIDQLEFEKKSATMDVSIKKSEREKLAKLYEENLEK